MTTPFDILHDEIIKESLEYAKQRSLSQEKWRSIFDNCSSTLDIEANDKLLQNAFLYTNSETKLEMIGYRVGKALVEKLSRETPKLLTELECIKFICKEFWSAVFGKQVDNLRTNHQGVYVVQDTRFTTLKSLPEGVEYVKGSGYLLALPCGIIRGALSSLNIIAVVTPTVETIPATKFHIQIQ